MWETIWKGSCICSNQTKDLLSQTMWTGQIGCIWGKCWSLSKWVTPVGAKPGQAAPSLGGHFVSICLVRIKWTGMHVCIRKWDDMAIQGPVWKINQQIFLFQNLSLLILKCCVKFVPDNGHNDCSLLFEKKNFELFVEFKLHETKTVMDIDDVNLLSYCCPPKKCGGSWSYPGGVSKGPRYPGGIFEVSNWYLRLLSQPSNHHYLPNGHSGANDPWNPHDNPYTYISLIKSRIFPGPYVPWASSEYPSRCGCQKPLSVDICTADTCVENG